MLHDKDIREPLFDFLEERYGKVRIIEEKTMGRSRADIVMVTESCLIGIEIKSDADTYARLSRQVRDYDRYFDRNIVVVGTSHALHIKEHVPSYWGIVTVDNCEDYPDFYLMREPDLCPKTSLKNKLSILWRNELAEIQSSLDMPKYKDRSKDFVIEKIIEKFPDETDIPRLNELISELLFERDYNTVQEDLKEYRKGELQKAIEKESDPQKKIELMMKQAEKKKAFRPKRKRKRR
ncbi:MAG: sce7726 family protein [Lachnospiraceae bacterium]|nr:sce7726 family protein [Lachnospiraceae bacterium]